MISAFLTGYMVVHGNTTVGDSVPIGIWSTNYDPHEFCSGFHKATNDDVAHTNEYRATTFITKGIYVVEYFPER